MSQQSDQKQLSSQELSTLQNGTSCQIAQLIAESTSYDLSLQLMQTKKFNNPFQWQQVRLQLIKMMVVEPEIMYISDSFLRMDRLLVIRDVFREEEMVDQRYFCTESGFVLLAITEGYLMQELRGERLGKLKQCFVRALKKEPSFWGLGQLQNLQNNIIDSSTGYFPSWSQTQHDLQLSKIQYFFQFITTYDIFTMFPQTIDINTLLLKMMLCLKEERERDRNMLVRMRKYYFEGRYHYQTTLRNMKFSLQFYRNMYNEKQCLYFPQRIINGILDHYDQKQIQNLFDGSYLGLKWTNISIHNFFINNIKIGVTQATVKVMVAMIKFCQKRGKYSQLTYAFENNIGRLFIFLRYSKLYNVTAKLIKYFIFSPLPQMNLYQKFIEKALPLASSISEDIKYPFLNILQVTAYLYRQTTVTTEIMTVVDSFIVEGVNRLTEEEMKQEIDEYSWKISVKNKKMGTLVQSHQPGYRGLINIGNSCYLNSFLQSLFMNKEFSKEVLMVSTLELERQRMKDITLQGKDPSSLSKTIREDLRPLAELQRIFALLQTSKRSEITPLPIRNISPPQFRNNFQHDSIQYGRLLLDLLYKNKIKKIFEGQVITAITCQGCGNTRERKEIFLDLMINPSQEQQQNVQESMAISFQDEIIHDLICDYCNERRDNSLKKHFISKLPDYLIISIKRFSYSVTEKKNTKIMSKITIQPTISINGQLYDLYSLIVHRGPSPNAGHYFQFSKNGPEGIKWLCHNDSEVTEIQGVKKVLQFLETNQSDTPYILFYERREHILKVKQELMKPITLRPQVEHYVQKDFLELQKSKQKKILPIFSPFNLPFFKPDEDDDGNNNQNNFYNSYVS